MIVVCLLVQPDPQWPVWLNNLHGLPNGLQLKARSLLDVIILDQISAVFSPQKEISFLSLFCNLKENYSEHGM